MAVTVFEIVKLRQERQGIQVYQRDHGAPFGYPVKRALARV